MSAAWTTIRLGTPAAAPYEEVGLEVPSDRAACAWVDARRRTELRLRLEDTRPRMAVLDAVPEAGLSPLQARVVLNGRQVARLELQPQRSRYSIDLPVERQQVGDNRLGFIFDKAGSPRGPAGHPYAARLFGLAVGAPSAALSALAAAGAPPFACGTDGDALVQVGPGAVKYALEAGEGRRLHFRPELHPWTRSRHAPVRLSVAVETEEGQQELWTATLDARRHSAPEAWVALPADASRAEPRRLVFRADTGDGLPAWVSWRDVELVAPPAATTQAPRGLDRVKRSLEGVNVVLIVLDAAGARHFSCYGHDRHTTPEIDRMAAEGVLFERAYTPAPFTLAAMASLWTSRQPDEHHRNAAYDDRLPEGVPTLAELLSARGIDTAGFVGNGMAGRDFGLHRGFGQFAFVGHRAAEFRSTLTSFLGGRAPGRPFFLYLHYREPHSPYDPGPPFETLFGSEKPAPPDEVDRWMEAVNSGQRTPTPAELRRLEQLYDGNLALADREIGWLRGRLEAAGLWERTVVIATADHGEALGEHRFVGHTQQLYEESVHIPLVIRFPAAGGLHGRRVPTLVDLLDLAPTVADVFGLLGDRRSASFRGRSLLPVALGGPGRGALLSRSAGPRPRYALIQETTKFIFNSRYGLEEMYDLSRDPGEQDDLLTRRPLLASLNRQRLHEMLLALPGRWSGPPAAWRLPAERLEELKALGYVR